MTGLASDAAQPSGSDGRWTGTLVSASDPNQIARMLNARFDGLFQVLAWLGQGQASRDDETARKIIREALDVSP